MSKDAKRRGRPDLQGSADLDVHLLETAARLFAEGGYEGTSVDRIAAAAGAGKQSLYRRYPTKEALFAAVSTRMIGDVMESWRAKIAELAEQGIVDIEDPLEDLRRTARMIMEFVLEPRTVSVFALLVSERLRFPRLNDHVEAMGQELENQIMRRIVSAQDRKLLRKNVHPDAPRHMMGLIAGWPIVQALMGQPNLDTEADRDRFFEAAWQAFLDSISPLASSTRGGARAIGPRAS